VVGGAISLAEKRIAVKHRIEMRVEYLLARAEIPGLSVEMSMGS
jgi:hypothetical protein